MSFDPKDVILQNFDMEEKQVATEEELIALLTSRIEEMLDHEPDILMSSLYRLDVLEHKILAVFDNPAIPNAEGLARLILDRQKEKQETRRKFGGEAEDFWSE